MAYDLENADFILSFRRGVLIEGWGAPGARDRRVGAGGTMTPRSRHRRSSRWESRASNTASKADTWVAAPAGGRKRPLALGMANVMIRENLVDDSFLFNYTHGL